MPESHAENTVRAKPDVLDRATIRTTATERHPAHSSEWHAFHSGAEFVLANLSRLEITEDELLAAAKAAFPRVDWRIPEDILDEELAKLEQQLGDYSSADFAARNYMNKCCFEQQDALNRTKAALVAFQNERHG